MESCREGHLELGRQGNMAVQVRTAVAMVLITDLRSACLGSAKVFWGSVTTNAHLQILSTRTYG